MAKSEMNNIELKLLRWINHLLESENDKGLEPDLDLEFHAHWKRIHEEIFRLKKGIARCHSLQARLEDIMEVILKHSQLQFDEKAPISGEHDELDGISLGINTLAEEFGFHQQKIEQLNEDLQRLLYRSSHDLRGPISSIHGLVEVLDVSGQLSPENKADFMKMIETAYRTLDKLAHCSQVVRAEIIISKIDINAFISNWIKDKKAELPDCQIEWEARHRSTYLHTDEEGLLLILHNLLENVINHAYKAEIKPKIIQLKTSDYADEFRIDFCDFGIGVGSNLQDKLFTMFTSGVGTEYSSGLGLYSSKKMAELMNGDLSLKSGSNPTIFTLTLPNRIP